MKTVVFYLIIIYFKHINSINQKNKQNFSKDPIWFSEIKFKQNSILGMTITDNLYMQSMSLLASMQVAFSFFFGSYFSQRALTYKIVLIPSVKKTFAQSNKASKRGGKSVFHF